MSTDAFARKIKSFAREIQNLLNRTIANYVHITAMPWHAPSGDRGFNIGNRLSKTRPNSERFPLRATRSQVELWMDVSFQLLMDAEREHLMVTKSLFGIYPSQGSRDARCSTTTTSAARRTTPTRTSRCTATRERSSLSLGRH